MRVGERREKDSSGSEFIEHDTLVSSQLIRVSSDIGPAPETNNAHPAQSIEEPSIEISISGQNRPLRSFSSSSGRATEPLTTQSPRFLVGEAPARVSRDPTVIATVSSRETESPHNPQSPSEQPSLLQSYLPLSAVTTVSETRQGLLRNHLSSSNMQEQQQEQQHSAHSRITRQDQQDQFSTNIASDETSTGLSLPGRWRSNSDMPKRRAMVVRM